MTKRCSILQSKLNELESRLRDALLLHDHDDQHQFISEDIKQKFVFIKSLLSAEISSSPSSSTTPHHLQHVGQRIQQLEHSFLRWDSSRDFSGGEEFEVASSCSCTESCFNDDGGDAGAELCVDAFAEPEEFPDDSKAMVEWKETEECSKGFDGEQNKAMVKWKDEEKKTHKLGSFMVYEDARDHFLEAEGLDHHGELVSGKELGNNDVTLKSIEIRREEGKISTRENNKTSSELGHVCGALSCGLVLGMVFSGFVMLRFSGCIHFVDQSYFPIPT
ncbi:uncharacterized protein LOC129314909 [Prosopis cineraria]|uniref:uncharacterized protein LOC129314909 n=1 Tax=Prosopis cineraria TaxID=364024 RepID=UPI0024107B50|nr:uncharacterized protein LOC129314909 [Prosopis cineraria]